MIHLLVKPKIWVIIPAYNESEYLDRVLRKLKQHWQDFVVVDDGSVDSTYSIAKKHTSHALKHPINLGKGAALKTGCEYAFSMPETIGVVFFDGDDQHDPELIKAMVKELKQSPVVLGIRAFNNKMPLIKILFNRLASVITLLFFGEYIPDIPSGFKALTRSAYKQVRWTSRDYLVEMEIAAKVALHKIPFRTISIPTVYHDLDRGMTVLDILHMTGKILSWKVLR